MKKISILVLFIALVFTFFGSASAEDKGVGVLIKCPADSIYVKPDTAIIQAQQMVGFKLNTNGLDSCLTLDSVNVISNSPIGNFKLTRANPFKTITFPNSGTYTYQVAYITAGADTAQGTVIVTPPVPTMTQWGVIILVALIIISGIIIIWKRRKAAVLA